MRNAFCQARSCSIRREVNAKEEIGDVAVAMQMTASGGVQYTSNPVIECVDALTEDMVTKAIPVMRDPLRDEEVEFARSRPA